MSDEQNKPLENDPLSGAAEGWEPPKFPVLAPDRICRFTIEKATKKATKDGNGEILELILKTTKDYVDSDSKPLRSGYTVYRYVGLTPTDGTDGKRARTLKENIGPELAEILKAVGIKGKSPRDLLNDPDMLKGQLVDCKVGLSKPTAEYPNPSNTVKFVIPG